MFAKFHPGKVRAIRFLYGTCFVLLSTITMDLMAQRESPYTLRQSEEAPLWVIELYKPDADPGIVLKLYDEYYKTHPFVKNQHTQYLKRWISGLNKRVVPNPEIDSIYLQRYFEAKHQRNAANWTTVGPIDWDHTAASRS